VLDFGSAYHFRFSNRMSEFFGTTNYVAPEVIKGKYTEKCDIWSIGVILYTMIAGMPPYQGKDETEIIAKIQKTKGAQVTNDFWKRKSPELRDLLVNLMNPDPKSRFSAQEALSHPWFNSQKEPMQKLAPTQIEHFTNFTRSSKLHLLAVSFIATHLLADSETQEQR
jgi:calcium-dependent protein kinase